MTGTDLVAALAARAATRPDDVAILVDGGGDLTFGGWETQAIALAGGLAAGGVRPGDRVALRFDARRWTDYAVAYLGVLQAGAVAVLVPAGLGATDAARIVRHSGASAVLCPCDLAVPPSGFAWADAPGVPGIVLGASHGVHAGQGLLAATGGAGPLRHDQRIGPDHRDPAGRRPAAQRQPLPTRSDGLGEGRGERLRHPEEGPPPMDVVYARAPLARAQVLAGNGAGRPLPAGAGWLVHAWAPGSPEGQHALRHCLSETGAGVATLARFSVAALCDLVDRLGAATCGLPPGLAAAVAGSGIASSAALGAVASVLLGPSDHPAPIGRALTSAFPAATIHHLGHLSQDTPTAAAGRSGVPGDSSSPQNLGAAPAGASQLGMLWHEQLAPGSFNLPSLVRRYRGTLDAGALQAALAELVRRHEPLRTTFDLSVDGPRQVVGDAEAFGVATVDLGHLAPEARHLEVARLVHEASTRPFDLVEDPLFAATLVRLGDDDHVLVLRLHHTVFDDWSVDVLRRDLTDLYRAVLGGEPSPLPALPARFVEVCRRQQARLAGEGGQGQLAWWGDQLAGAPLAVQLRLGEPHQLRPDRPGAGEPLRHDLPPELARQVRALAPGLRATPFMTVLAAFGVLVGARTGLDDLVVASVVAGRGATALEPMIGCFTKKVLLRLRLDGDPTFPELVARTRATVLGALAHQDPPFEAVVQHTLGRVAARHGLAATVPVIFQGETPQPSRLVLPGVEVGPFELPASARREQHFSASRADDEPEQAWGDGAYLGTFLLLSLLESDEGLALVARGVFHHPAAQQLLVDLEAVLGEIVAAPTRRLSELAAAPPAAPAGAGGADDELAVVGLRLRRRRMEAALGHCPGVADVGLAVAGHGDGGGGGLVAYVVASAQPPPTLAELRAALWAALPGAPWPARLVVPAAGPPLPRRADGQVDAAALPPPEPHARAPGAPDPQRPDPTATLLATLWGRVRGAPVDPGTSYWQDFSFLGALAQARAAGLPVTDEQVARCRTPEMLAAALTAAARPSPEP